MKKCLFQILIKRTIRTLEVIIQFCKKIQGLKKKKRLKN